MNEQRETGIAELFAKATQGSLPFEAMTHVLEALVGAGNLPVGHHFYQTWASNLRGRIKVAKDAYARAQPLWQKLHAQYPEIDPLPQPVDWLRFNLNGRTIDYRDIDDPYFMEIIDRVHKHTITMLEGVEPPWEMYKAIEYVVRHKIPGDLVECGVWNGGSVLLMALALMHFGDTSRKIYLYDTFEGMPQPEDVDRNWDGVPALPTWEEKKRKEPDAPNWGFGGTVAMVQEVVYASGYPKENFVFVKGMVEDTLPAHKPEQISLLRLDTDFYSSTYHELVTLYPVLVPGGVLIIDDYGYFQGARLATDKYLEETAAPLFLSRVTQSVRLAIKPAGQLG